jgi:hypothetical protein
VAASSVRTGEFAASPWVDERGGPRGSGYIIQSGELPGIASSVDRIDMQLYEPVMIAPPVGAAPPARQLYLAYKLGPFIEEFGQIVIPTGIVEVTRTPQTGEATVARVLKKFGVVRRDQRLIAYDSSAGVVRGAPLPVLNGRMGTVRWILNQPVLPTFQSYLVLDLKRSEGVNTGDQIELYLPRQRPTETQSLTIPEISIGRAQVLRVTPFGATAIITAQEQPKIEEGTSVRVSAKMP